MSKPHQQFEPVTFGHLRRAAQWLHLYCTVCGHEREFDVNKPPFDHLPDSTVGADARPIDGLLQVWDEGQDLERAGIPWGFSGDAEAVAPEQLGFAGQLAGRPPLVRDCSPRRRPSNCLDVGRRKPMDATTLYVIVQMASGEARTALKVPLREGQSCERAKLDADVHMRMHEQFVAGAKLATVFCTGPAVTAPAVRRW